MSLKNFLASGLMAKSHGMKSWERNALFFAMNDCDRHKSSKQSCVSAPGRRVENPRYIIDDPHVHHVESPSYHPASDFLAPDGEVGFCRSDD